MSIFDIELHAMLNKKIKITEKYALSVRKHFDRDSKHVKDVMCTIYKLGKDETDNLFNCIDWDKAQITDIVDALVKNNLLRVATANRILESYEESKTFYG